MTGLGGAGVYGSNLTIINNGSIAGGLSGDGSQQAPAIDFTGGANTLTTNGRTYTGGIVIETTSTSLTLSQTAAAGATGSATYSASTVISGAGSLIVTTDSGYSVTLSAVNTYTGGTTVN